MLRETGVLLRPRLGLPPNAENGDVRKPISLKEIFEGQEYLLCDLTPEQMYYLRFVVTYRLVKAGGDETETKYLLQLLNREDAERMASQLREQREIIFKAIPLPIEELNLADPNDFTETRKMLDHLQGYPSRHPSSLVRLS